MFGLQRDLWIYICEKSCGLYVSCDVIRGRALCIREYILSFWVQWVSVFCVKLAHILRWEGYVRLIVHSRTGVCDDCRKNLMCLFWRDRSGSATGKRLMVPHLCCRPLLLSR